MFTVVLRSLLLASSGILSVGSMMFAILLLISEQGWRNGAAYMVGYIGAYELIGVFVVFAGNTIIGEAVILVAVG